MAKYIDNSMLKVLLRTKSKAKKASENPCDHINCGEAGCVVVVGNKRRRAQCRCALSLREPDEYLRCNRTVRNLTVGPMDLDNTGANEYVFPSIRKIIESPNESAVLPRDTSHLWAWSLLGLLFFAIVAVGVAVVVVLFVKGGRVKRWRHSLRTRSRSDRRADPRLSVQGHSQAAASSSAEPIFHYSQLSSSSAVEASKFRADRGANTSAGPGSDLFANLQYSSHNPNYTPMDLNIKLMKYKLPKESIRILNEIGQGAFSKVYKAMLTTGSEEKLVAVKIPRDDISGESFYREASIMGEFHHKNILGLRGIIDGDPPCMVFDFMNRGDLTTVLRNNSMTQSSENQLMSKESLTDIAVQIASGMSYLSSMRFIHRDLASRNCLLTDGNLVKISDFGLSKDVYTSDYYKVGGSRVLPIRWLSPECILYGKFTVQSDVWAFGVVLWEIFTYGKQPYYGKTNEEMMQMANTVVLLEKPKQCPDDVYNLMISCWNRLPKERPTFQKIFTDLQGISLMQIDESTGSGETT